MSPICGVVGLLRTKFCGADRVLPMLPSKPVSPKRVQSKQCKKLMPILLSNLLSLSKTHVNVKQTVANTAH